MPRLVNDGRLLHPCFGLAVVAAAALATSCEKEILDARATVTVSPSSIAFGKVATGQTRSIELQLTNDAPSATLRVDRIALAEGSATVFAVEQIPSEIPAQTSATVVVTYTPDDADPDAGALEIDTDALDEPYVTIPLSSERTFPAIAVRPATLDLGNIESGGRATGTIRIESAGDATLVVGRLSLRTAGFAGEACFRDGDCREGRCTPSASGRICAVACDTPADCTAGYTCTTDTSGYRACREAEGTTAPRARRGFAITSPSAVEPLLPGTAAVVEILYEPGATDRGSAQLVVESNDANQPSVVVPILGRPDNLPPVAVAAMDGAAPDPILPGTRIALTGEGSRDPEGEAITHRWRFVRRPEGSRAAFEDPAIAKTAFTVDRPGTYVAALEVRDERGVSSTNDARVEVEASAGTNVRVALSWDRPGTDLDLHFVSPGAAFGSLGDCFFDNPTPDWRPAGPQGDPIFSGGATDESIVVADPFEGVYTVQVKVVAASPEGPTGATLRVFFEDVPVAAFFTNIPVTADAWDVVTLSWPAGRLTALDTIR